MSDEREARAEQLVEAFVRAIEAADDYACSPRDYAEAVLNVVRTERSQITCATCGGDGHDRNVTEGVDACARCNGRGSVPGELLVVGLIGDDE